VAAGAAVATDAGQVLAVASSVDEVLTNIRNWIMGILAGLATVFLTIGGVRYVMAAGDPGEVEKAKTAFKSAGWGYGLAALAPLDDRSAFQVACAAPPCHRTHRWRSGEHRHARWRR
jgi:hypothetical protein